MYEHSVRLADGSVVRWTCGEGKVETQWGRWKEQAKAALVDVVVYLPAVVVLSVGLPIIMACVKVLVWWEGEWPDWDGGKAKMKRVLRWNDERADKR